MVGNMRGTNDMLFMWINKHMGAARNTLHLDGGPTVRAPSYRFLGCIFDLCPLYFLMLFAFFFFASCCVLDTVLMIYNMHVATIKTHIPISCL